MVSRAEFASSYNAIRDDGLREAVRQIEAEYGVRTWIKPKSLRKLGHNGSVGTAAKQTVWDFEQDETYVSANVIDTISSSDAADNIVMTIEGHTIDGNGEFTFVVQTATLNGQNKVTLSTPLARASRLYNSNGGEFFGTLYVYQDGAITAGVPDDPTTVHVTAQASDQQSLKCATTLSKSDYWLVTGFGGGVVRQSGTEASFDFEIRLKGGVFRTTLISVASSNGPMTTFALDPPLIVPANADVRIRAQATSIGTGVFAFINGYLAEDAEKAGVLTS